jgi:hypothetical protein
VLVVRRRYRSREIAQDCLRPRALKDAAAQANLSSAGRSQAKSKFRFGSQGLRVLKALP